MLEVTKAAVDSDKQCAAQAGASMLKLLQIPSAQALSWLSQQTKNLAKPESLKKTGITINQVYSHFEPNGLKLSPITSTFSCMDFKGQRPIIGTPGGDFGEFLLAFHTYRQLKPQADISFNSVKEHLSEFVSKHCSEVRPFYKHTDAARLEAINEQMKVTEFPRHRPANISDWFSALVNPENHGCGHLRSILTDPAAYNLEPELVKSTVCAFYDLYWSENHGKHMILEILAHPKDMNLESGLVVHQHTCEHDKGKSHAFTPYQEGVGLFSVNPPAQTTYREDLTIPFFLEKINDKTLSKDEFMNTLNQNYLRYWATTGTYLNIVNLPLIEINNDGHVQ